MEAQRNNANHRRGARPSVGYLLFQYQSELTRRHAEPTRLSRTKIHIIDGLVSRTIRHMKHCSMEDLRACKRELVYKEQLRDQLKNMRRKRSSSVNKVEVTANTSAPLWVSRRHALHRNLDPPQESSPRWTSSDRRSSFKFNLIYCNFKFTSFLNCWRLKIIEHEDYLRKLFNK